MEDYRNKYDVQCIRAKGAYIEEAPSEIWSNPDWVLEPKEDGERVTLQVGTTESLLIGRNRQDFMKGVKKAKEFRNRNHLNTPMASCGNIRYAGTLFDGELTEKFNQNGKLSKTTRERAKIGHFVGYTVWTVFYFKGVDVRQLTEARRYELAGEAVRAMKNPKIRLIERHPATKEVLQKLFDQGYEGAVAKYLPAGIPLDKRTNPNWWKVKGDDKRTVDAFIVGVNEGASGGSGVRGVKRQPNGRAATFTVAMVSNPSTKEIVIGKMGNLTDQMKEDGFKNFKKYKGRVVEMRVSGWNGKAFRYPRFVKWRPDKSKDDCRMSEQIGK